MEKEKNSKYNKEKDTKYRKKVYDTIKKTGKTPQWVLNEREYSKKYYSGMGYKSIQVLLSKEENESLKRVLNKKNINKEQFIELIINKYL